MTDEWQRLLPVLLMFGGILLFVWILMALDAIGRRQDRRVNKGADRKAHTARERCSNPQRRRRTA
jgi:hypothetical protein